MSDRKEIIAILQQQIKEQRDRLDPELLARAGEAAAEQMKKAEAKQKEASTSVPYDRESAAKAVELFLKTHPDPESLEKLLAEIEKKIRH